MEQDATASPAIAAGQESVPAIAAVHGAGSAPGVTAAAPGTGLRLFLVHAPEDAWFVDGFLLPALGLSEHEVLCSGKVELGAVIVQEIERGAVLPVTVVVVSPAFLASPWAQFANQLAVHHSVEAAKDDSAMLVPVILADCELPDTLRRYKHVDYRRGTRAAFEEILAAYAGLTGGQLLTSGRLPASWVAKLVQYDEPVQTPLTAPVMIVQGTADQSVPKFLTDELRERLPAGHTYLEIENGTHDSAVTASAQAVADWIALRFQ